MDFEQGTQHLPFALCPANCVIGASPEILPRTGRMLTALNRCPGPHQTTDVLIHGARYVPENQCASAAQMCLGSDKNRACELVQEGPVVSVHTHARIRGARLHWPISEQPSASWDSLPHITAQLRPCLDPHCLEGHAQPPGLAYPFLSLFHSPAMPFTLPGPPMFLPSQIYLF